MRRVQRSTETDLGDLNTVRTRPRSQTLTHHFLPGIGAGRGSARSAPSHGRFWVVEQQIDRASLATSDWSYLDGVGRFSVER